MNVVVFISTLFKLKTSCVIGTCNLSIIFIHSIHKCTSSRDGVNNVRFESSIFPKYK